MESLASSVVRMSPTVFLLLLLWSRGYSQCLQGLPTESELFSSAVTAENQNKLFLPPPQQPWLFPSLIFNCTGSVYKWRGAASPLGVGQGQPVLIVWRQNPGSESEYRLISEEIFTNCPVQELGGITVYESFPEQLMQFEPGDVLGLFLRPDDIVRFQPYLLQVNDSADLSYYDIPPGRGVPDRFTIDSSQGMNVLPLLSLEICVSDNQTEGSYPLCADIDLEAERAAQNCNPTGPPPTVSAAVTTPTSSSTSALSRGVLIVVIVVPAALLILLLVAAILIVVICCCRREPEKHPYPNEVPATDLIPMANNVHPSDYSGSTTVAHPTMNSVVISVHQSSGYNNRPVHNHTPQVQREEIGSMEDQGAPYEEPMQLLSQSTEVPPPIPPPLHSPATFSGRASPNFPLISPLSSQTPTGTFRSRRHSPLPPLPTEDPPPSAARTFYHTLERPEHNQSPRGSFGTPPLSRTRSPEWRHRLDSSSSRRLRARSVDELSHLSDPHSPRQQFDNHLSVAGIVEGGLALTRVPSQCHYHTLEGPNTPPVGIYVPTQSQRSQCLSEYEPLFDDKIYSCLKKSPNSPRGYNQFFKESDTYWKPATDMTQLYLQLASKKYREIIRKQIQITEHLGSGEFGTVCRGMWRGIKGELPVAVKMLNSKATEKDALRFLQEAAIMGQFRHPNIVRMYGVVTVGEPIMIVLELMKKGDLRRHLKSLRPVPGELVPPRLPQNLLDYSSQIALGMEYLARKEFVHRDLAARNVLLTEDCVCKIGDFGMSRDLDDDNYYISNGGKIPIKWTAPEAILYRKYSTASDVWSFGVLVYEIWSLGHTPFRHKSPEEAIKLIEEGHRLAPPPGCPKAIYTLMIECWHTEPSARPSFTSLVQTLSQSDEVLLKWDNEEVKLPQARTIGVPMELGEKLYPELQKRYTPATSEYVEI